MNFQYVFGNPIAGKSKKKLAKKKNKHKLDNKKRKSMAKKKMKAKSAGKRLLSAPLKKSKKTAKKRNPAFLGSRKGEPKKVSAAYPSKTENKKIHDRLQREKLFAKSSKIKAVKRKAARESKFLLGRLKQNTAKRKLAEKEASQMRKQGLDVTKLEGSISEVQAKLEGLQMAKKKHKKAATKKTTKKTAKKAGTKKKKARSAKQRANDKKLGLMASKRHASKKKSKKTSKKKSKKTSKKTVKKAVHKKSAKKTVKKTVKKTAKKKAAVKKKSYKKFSLKKMNKMKKGSTYHTSKGKKKYSIKRTNPTGGMMSKFSDMTGHTIKEAGGLAVGGLAYGAVNGLMTKIPGIKNVQAQLVKVPVIGTSLPTLLMGVALNMLSSKIKNKQAKDAIEVLGSGLVGASIVGMGVNASQFIPGLKAAGLSGVNYTPMNGVEYTPMNGVEYTMNGEADFGHGADADFGGIPSGMGIDAQDAEDSDEFGGIPSGMSGEQMG